MAKAYSLAASDFDEKPPAAAPTRLRWNVLGIAWLQQILCNFAWVPLAAYAERLQLDGAVVGSLFAVHVGIRVVPNMIVTRWGAKTEFPMMVAATAGFLAAFYFPTAMWALYAMAAGGGLAFTRGCVTLHTQAFCDGDLDLLGRMSRHCGMARMSSDVFGFIVPPALYQFAGWQCFTLFGAALPMLYMLLAAPLYARAGTETSAALAAEAAEKRRSTLRWVDWVVATAFVGTELQWYLLNAAVPAALARSYGLPPSQIGGVFAMGCLAAFAYLTALPCLPKLFNKHRPLNLLITYSGMAAAWILMTLCLTTSSPAPVFTILVFLFLAMATASQVVLLECLMGVGDTKSTAKVLGISEVLGCTVGMCSSYAGGALVDFAVPAPFFVAALISVLLSTALALALGRRRADIAHDAAGARTVEAKAGACALAVVGLRLIASREEDYIGQELAYRGLRQAAVKDVNADMEATCSLSCVDFAKFNSTTTADENGWGAEVDKLKVAGEAVGDGATHLDETLSAVEAEKKCGDGALESLAAGGVVVEASRVSACETSSLCLPDVPDVAP